jgi:FkbM family methyltransferase
VLYAVQQGMLVCDIGASFGYYTLLMAEKVGPTGHVFSFEPNPRINRLLRQSVSVNGFESRVTVHDFGLGLEDVSIMLHASEESVGGGFIHPDAKFEGLESFSVQIRRLDNVIDQSRPVGFLKIDVEGFEEAVMQGASELLTKPELRAVLIEFRRVADLPDGLPSYISHLFERGMTAEALEPDGVQPLSCVSDVMELPRDHLTNLLFKAC